MNHNYLTFSVEAIFFCRWFDRQSRVDIQSLVQSIFYQVTVSSVQKFRSLVKFCEMWIARLIFLWSCPLQLAPFWKCLLADQSVLRKMCIVGDYWIFNVYFLLKHKRKEDMKRKRCAIDAENQWMKENVPKRTRTRWKSRLAYLLF